MINVAFLLLIFFLLAAVIEPVAGDGVTPPEVAEGAAAGDGLRIGLDVAGRLTDGAGALVDPDALAGSDVVLSVDGGAEARVLAEALGALEAAGAGRVTLIARETGARN